MKLVCLNTYGGKLIGPLINFLKKYYLEIDIFCFQEIFDTTSSIKVSNNYRLNLLKELSYILKDYQVFYSPFIKEFNFKESVDFDLSFGNAIFIKKDIRVKSFKDVMIYRKKSDDIGKNRKKMPRNIQVLKISKDGKVFTIFNLHGLTHPGDKLDTAERIAQSKKIKKQLDQIKKGRILTGDFNLYPETESLKMLEGESGMINLIKKYEIKNTRVKRFCPDQTFADYTLVSKDINVKSFKVFNDIVSDHLPMYLEFE